MQTMQRIEPQNHLAVVRQRTPQKRMTEAEKAARYQAIFNLLTRLLLQYSKQYSPAQIGALCQDWYADLNAYTVPEIAEAAKLCRQDEERRFFPSSGEFLAYCRIAKKQLAQQANAVVDEKQTHDPLTDGSLRTLGNTERGIAACKAILEKLDAQDNPLDQSWQARARRFQAEVQKEIANREKAPARSMALCELFAHRQKRNIPAPVLATPTKVAAEVTA